MNSEVVSMKTSLMVVGLVLASTAAGAKSATTVCTPDPLLGARSIAFSVNIGGTMSSLEDVQELFGGLREAQAVLEDHLTSAVGGKLQIAGYEFETQWDLWSTRDRRIYEGTGVPHHALNVHIYGQALDPPNCKCGTSSAFLIYVTLDAEFLTPKYESIETFSFERLGMATDSDLESKIVATTSAIVDDILEPSDVCPPLEKTTLMLEGANYSLVLTPPGYGDLLRYLRGVYGEPVIAELYAEPRSVSAEPLVTFPLINGVPPKRILRDQAGRFVIALHTWPRRGSEYRPLIVIYRSDGSALRSLSLGDLLTNREWLAIETPAARDQWPYADHFIDENKSILVLSIPACLFFEQDCSNRYSQLEVDLGTGQRLHPSKHVIPRWQGRCELVLPQKYRPIEEQARHVDWTCRRGWSEESFDGVPEVRIEDLLPDSSLPMPVYTITATTARVTGTLELEILLSELGDVVCAGVRKGLPMGLNDSAASTVLSWKLSPLRTHPERLRSQVKFRCGFGLVESGQE